MLNSVPVSTISESPHRGRLEDEYAERAAETEVGDGPAGDKEGEFEMRK